MPAMGLRLRALGLEGCPSSMKTIGLIGICDFVREV